MYIHQCIRCSLRTSGWRRRCRACSPPKFLAGYRRRHDYCRITRINTYRVLTTGSLRNSALSSDHSGPSSKFDSKRISYLSSRHCQDRDCVNLVRIEQPVHGQHKSSPSCCYCKLPQSDFRNCAEHRCFEPSNSSKWPCICNLASTSFKVQFGSGYHYSAASYHIAAKWCRHGTSHRALPVCLEQP